MTPRDVVGRFCRCCDDPAFVLLLALFCTLALFCGLALITVGVCVYAGCAVALITVGVCVRDHAPDSRIDVTFTAPDDVEGP